MEAAASDTIVALSSGSLPAAIAVVRMSGPRAPEVAEAIAGALPAPRTASLRVLRDPSDASPIDEALVLHFPAPDTATGEEIVEFQCHGSNAVVRKLIDVMTSVKGCRLAQPGEFTRRALESGRVDLTAAEGLGDLLAAETEAQRRSALRIARGGLHDELASLLEKLVTLSARLEAAIDYVGDEEETGGQDDALRAEFAAIRDKVDELIAKPSVEPLREGIRVVVGGPTNAGKSSLINKLAGSARVIVSDIHGTTRDLVEIPVSIGGVPFTLVDTAGLRESDDTIEQIGIELAGQAQRDADILLWLGDPDQMPEHPRAILVRSKSDLDETSDGTGIAVSSKTGDGLPSLMAKLTELARGIVPTADEIGLSDWQADTLRVVRETLDVHSEDLAILADSVRSARVSVGRLLGAGDVEDVLDRLFGKFCLGK
ncbi:tRNA uridine-5-carboxymethylaminomethyl(34) synthesis GTPase MnmE [Sphingomicrobium clamense]|uniref:tRNA modification GTPase MnmE n=1 Tax=Sphingomicrobium clamense TaxID=2851013 RepID=A0ABS6V302_9SPHN|nr:tRNA uridine-5-carboxymethylaminomethyl(34) synthesis GTPase MnmE [Sphingomicrobium sp. B8]